MPLVEAASIETIPPAPPLNATWRGTWSLIKADLKRRLTLEVKPQNLLGALSILPRPGVVCVVAYRLSNYMHYRGWRIAVRCLEDAQHLYTGVEIHVGSRIGPGLVVGDLPGGGIAAESIIGSNFTMLGCGTISPNSDGIDPEKDDILIGDHCVLGINARIIGNVKLADATQIKPNAVVLADSLETGAILDGIPARRKQVVAVTDVARWNPLKPWECVR